MLISFIISILEAVELTVLCIFSGSLCFLESYLFIV